MEVLIERGEILKVLYSFYTEVMHNQILKNHFEVLHTNFNGHVENIADFWDLTLNSKRKMKNPSNSKFDVIGVHLSLKPTQADLEEWIKLFKECLFSYAEGDQGKLERVRKWWKITLNIKKFFELKIINNDANN